MTIELPNLERQDAAPEAHWAEICEELRFADAHPEQIASRCCPQFSTAIS
ncbi:MAG: hypothetical protein ACFB21_00355 [Opitutales bacterium]